MLCDFIKKNSRPKFYNFYTRRIFLDSIVLEILFLFKKRVFSQKIPFKEVYNALRY